MGLQTLMHRRGAVYYYRQRVPLELIPCIGKTELRLSLATSDAKEAVKRLRILSANIIKQFDALRTGQQPTILLDYFSNHKTNAMPVTVRNTDHIKLDALLDEWVTEQGRAGKPISSSTLSEWQLSVRQFKEINGDIAIQAIKKEHTRGNFTMPHSIASISEKSLMVHGNSVPSAQPEPLRKNGVAERSYIARTPSFLLNASRPLIHNRAALFSFSASCFSSPFNSSNSSLLGFSR